MVGFRWRAAKGGQDADFPLDEVHIDVKMEAEFAIDGIPEEAIRRMVWTAFRGAVADSAEDQLEIANGDSGMVRMSRIGAEDVENWVQPAGIDMRIIKSAHRVIEELGVRSANGQATLASQLVRDGLVSAPTMGRLLRRDEIAGQYLAPFVSIHEAGRTKGLDLTPRGRKLASLIRAGTVPS